MHNLQDDRWIFIYRKQLENIHELREQIAVVYNDVPMKVFHSINNSLKSDLLCQSAPECDLKCLKLQISTNLKMKITNQFYGLKLIIKNEE